MTAARIDQPHALLGGLSATTFMRRYWQRRPLLVRAAVDPYQACAAHLPPRERIGLPLLRRLAALDEVESRLVTGPEFHRGSFHRGSFKSDATRRLRRGPISRLPPLSVPDWTVLVQGLDLHCDPARALLDRFRFVADARLDDLMVSFASEGGGVGAHIDSYDVFLLQLAGQRQWSIAAPARRARSHHGVPHVIIPAGDDDSTLAPLANFSPSQSWLLDPGDMLYLPAGWAHEGIAKGSSLTASIGFRAPTPTQWLAALHAAIEEDCDQTPQRTLPLRDVGAVATQRPAAIPSSLATNLIDWQRHFKPSLALVERALGRLLTEPKPQVWFNANPFAVLTPGDAIVVDRRTRILYRGRCVFINGEAVEPPACARPYLQRLADQRHLSPNDVSAALSDPWLCALCKQWLAAGWLQTR